MGEVVVDGIHLSILPCQLPMLMQSPEDYANHYYWIVSTGYSLYCYDFTNILPAFYIAATFQNQMLPPRLHIDTNKLQDVPFSASEVLGLLIAFEILIEVGLRYKN